MLRVLSLGAGVQSTTLALMAACGEIDRLDCAIFADTGNEPQAVYNHLKELETLLPFPVHRVSDDNRNLGDEIIKATQGKSLRGSHARPPFFVANQDGSRGVIRRQCTGDYKIDPIEHKVRELIGLKPRQRWPRRAVVEQWLGISTDEASRMKPSLRMAITIRWPLIEKRMSRWDCQQWLTRHHYQIPPKSACVFCPYRSDTQWRLIRDTDPEGWHYAVTLDHAVRNGLRGASLKGKLYLHGSLRPLDEIDLSTDAERGQGDLFENECAGVCGV